MLSLRQEQIMGLILQGKTDKEIAAELGISKHTVGNHLRAVFMRFRVNCRMQAVRRWKRL